MEDSQKLQEIPIHQSLTRPFLLMNAEREVALFVSLVCGTFIFTWDKYLIGFAVIFWFLGMWGARKLAKEDPYLMKVYLKYSEYKAMYKPVEKTMIKEEAPASAEISTLLPYGTLIRPDVVLNKDGSLTACYWYQGKDVDSSTFDNRNVIATQIKDAINRLGTGWTIQTDTIRVEENHYPLLSESHFTDNVSKLIENERREMFEMEGNHYVTVNALTVTYNPPLKTESKLAAAFIKQDKSVKKSFATAHLKTFDNGLNPFISQISTHLSIERMNTSSYTDEEGEEHFISSILQYMNYCFTGENHEIEVPKSHFFIDSLLSYHTFNHDLMPRLDDKFIGVVSMSGFPQKAMPNILKALDSLPMQYRINFRFIAKDAYDAKKIVNKQQKKWEQKKKGFMEQLFPSSNAKINKDAERMDQDGEHVKDELDSGLVSYGYFNASIVIRNSDPDELEAHCLEVQKCLRNISFDGMIETLNCTEAFLGSLPGECLKNIRRPIVNSWNLTHLISLASIWAGRKYNPCNFYPDNSPPLMYSATSGSTPFRINLHCGDVGHLLVLGPSGNGKSVFTAMLMTQAQRYKDSQIFVFDKGHSAQPIIEGMGGSHYNIGADNSDLAFYPLSNVNGSTKDFLFCAELIESMMLLQKVKGGVTPADREEIIKALNLLKDQESQTLTDFLNSLSSEKIKQALSYYDHNGAFALLSGDPEEIPFHQRATCFEMAELMDMGEKVIVPTLLYLFHEIQKRLDGRPTFIFLAEAWTYFKDPIFKEKIVRYLKELRKKNCALVMDTQSLNEIMKSGIMADVQDNVPTKIFLPNTEAENRGTPTEPGPYECYKSFGLNDTQISIIKNSIPKREYYFTSREGNRIFSMNLGNVALSFVGRTGAKDLDKLQEIKGLYGEDWTYKWLEYCGADYYRFIKN